VDAMGKTIGLKLTEKEERIVSQLTKQGITHSDLLREALWNYFLPKDNDTSVDQIEEEKEEDAVSLAPEIINPLIADYIEHLKGEIDKLREENFRLQDQIRSEVSRMRGQLHRISTGGETSRIFARREFKPISDINDEVDNAIKKEPKKFEFRY
jgi:hypothetical protein